MLYVGIDIAKDKHDACVIDQEGHTLLKSFTFPNSAVGANALLDRVRKLNPESFPVTFGMEATGHYWLALYSHLKANAQTVCVINPVQSDALRNLYIRQTKTDTVDAFIIAEVLRFGRYTQIQLAEPDILALRNLCRYRMSLIDTISDIKRKVMAVMEQIFPEYEKLFSKVFGMASVELLSQCTTPEEILKVSTHNLADLLNEASKKRLGTKRAAAKAQKIQEAAASSFGVKLAADIMAFQVRQELEQIQLMEKHVAALDEQIASLYSKFDCTLHTMPGLGPVLAAIVLSEIGDVSRFSAPEKLVAYAGIDPSVRQSGNFSGNQNHMSKRGSPFLRRAIWLAAFVAAFNDPVFSAFYQKKRAEGKDHMTSVGAVSRKYLYTVFALLKSGRPYSPHPANDSSSQQA